MLWKNTKETGNGCFKEEQSNSETQGKGDIVSTISPFTNFFFYTNNLLLTQNS